MQLVEKVLGNSRDPEWAARLATGDVDTLELDQWDAQKTRLRKDTAGGVPVAVTLERGKRLHDGDVLAWNGKTAIVCTIALCDVLVIDLSGLEALPPRALAERCVQLGHALGNQHWPAVVSGQQVYVPLSVARAVMDSVMRAHQFAGISWDFAPGASVADRLDPEQARRLFGGAERPTPGTAGPHGHSHGAGQPDRHTKADCCGSAFHAHTAKTSCCTSAAPAHADTPQPCGKGDSCCAPPPVKTTCRDCRDEEPGFRCGEDAETCRNHDLDRAEAAGGHEPDAEKNSGNAADSFGGANHAQG